jgi:hypothetical protein
MNDNIGKRIVFLEDSFGNSKGEKTKVVSEDDHNIYYYDGFRRWCYFTKNERGLFFEYCN